MSKNLILQDLIKRDLFNKFESIIQRIKEKIRNDLTEEDKKDIIKKIALVIVLFQVDSLYKNITDVSGIVAILNSFGLSEKNSEIIRNLGLNGMNIATLAIMIFKFLKEENKN